MIDTEQPVTINADIDRVWTFVCNIRNWAGLMPGMRDCDVVDEDNSLWTLKVGVGALVRTVKVRVHVDKWDGPGQVSFSYKLEGDPVRGNGLYRATAKGTRQTDVCLKVSVEGNGPMAPMWEAMSRPLLPQLARSFAGQLKDKIEAASEAPRQPPASRPRSLSIIATLRTWFRTRRRAVQKET